MTGRDLGAIRMLLDLVIARRQIERVIRRRRGEYRLYPASPPSELAPLRIHGQLTGWEAQWRQFRTMCEAARPTTPGRPALPDAEGMVAKTPTTGELRR
jgi:hypothetical protein